MNALQKNDIKCKLIYDIEYSNKFFDINIKNRLGKQKKLKKLLDEFGPDVVLLDRLSGIATEITKANIPLFILIRGDFWEESKWARETIYTSPQKRLSFFKNQRFAKACFNNASVILPISKYLENVVRKNIPGKKVELLPADGRDPSEWNQISGMSLKHPCVGLVQGLNIWGKTRELNTLQDVMRKLPNVTFYLAGDGIYRNEIIPKLKKFENFVWMGNLEYPNDVKKFFSSLDVYLLLSGLEGLGQSIIESMLMKKPVIASNIGGIPEIVTDGETGFLVNLGDSDQIVHLINDLLSKPDLVKKITAKAEENVKMNYSWEFLAKKFSDILEKHHYK